MTASNDQLKIYTFGESLHQYNLDFENLIIHSKLKDFDKTVNDSGLSIKLTIRGEENYIIDNQKYTISPGKYLIVNKHQEFDCYLKSTEEVEAFCLYLSNDIVNEVYHNKFEEKVKTLDNPYYWKEGNINFLEKIYDLSENTLGFYLQKFVQKTSSEFPILNSDLFYYELAEKLLETQFEINNKIHKINSSKLSTKQELFRRLSRAQSFIFENFSKNIQLDDLSKIALLSKYHLLRTYKQIFGITPYQQVLQLRLEKSKELILKNYSLEEIAFQLGFSDRRSFTKAFKNSFKVSPSIFRKSQQIL